MRPYIEGYHPLDAHQVPSNPLMQESAAVLKMQTTLFRDTAVIDFEGRKITLYKLDKATGIPVWVYHYAELEEYMRSHQRFAFLRLWEDQQRAKAIPEKDKKRVPSLEFQLPVSYPAWARRVLGKEPPKLTIDGFQEISLTFESSETRTPGKEDLSKQPDLNFGQNNSFTIRGSVGRLISIEIKAGKEEEFDFSDPLKDFKIQYKEDSVGQLEDEIVQEVTAGFTNFEMPGAGLAGYSESHEGLFGIKIRSKWGPLTLTTIASHEQGEVEKKRFTPRAGTQNMSRFAEKDYLKYRFYFLDRQYLLKYLGMTQNVPAVTALQVYRWVPSPSTNAADLNRYVKAYYGSAEQPGHFVLLKETEHYYLDRINGWIRFIDSVQLRDDDIIAIVLRAADSTVITNKGDTTFVAKHLPADTVYTNLWVLKNRLADVEPATDSTWHLMWRNVYQIPEGANVDNFELKMYRLVSGSSDSSETEPSSGRYYTEILGIADRSGKPLTTYSGLNADGKTAIFDFQNKYFVIPPYAADTLGNRPFTNPALGLTSSESNTNPNIYIFKQGSTNWTQNITDKYAMFMTGSTRQTTFDLGWGVTNERVLLDGVTPLEENIDYIIDRESGRLELISDRAKLAKNIEVEYQQESFFVFEKRAFLGAHAKIDLPFIGRSSYLGASVLYQNETARDKIPRIGHVPFNKFLVGANTLIDFEPEWMTGAVNLLPLLTTAAPSSAKLNFEIAHSRQTPNTGAEAYIDDFESSNEVYSLGVHHSSWYRASPPGDFKNPVTGLWDSLLYNPPAWRWYWYTPEGDDRAGSERDSIWRLQDTTDLLENRYARTLRLVCYPAPPDSLKARDGTRLNLRYPASWAGIMTYLPGSLADREKDRYLELWVKNTAGGILHIDMGDVSEDLSLNGGPPNGMWDYENPRLDPNERDTTLDKGLDGLADTAEYWLVPNQAAGVWDTLRYGDPALGVFSGDPSRDNYAQYYRDKNYLANRSRVNGTQKDAYLTSEDINRNGWSSREKLFRTAINFNSLKANDRSDSVTFAYFDETSNSAQPTVWRRFRIPLKDNPHFDTVYAPGSTPPNWNDIKFVRLWWSDFPPDKMTDSLLMEFAAIDFVGNQWQPRPTGDSIKIEAGVLNTEDDPEIYNGRTMPPALVWELREQGSLRFLKKEQSLRLVYRGLARGEEAMAEHFYTYQNINLANYDEIRMFMRPHADPALMPSVNPYTWFVFRFGLNDSTYYEYRERFGAAGTNSLRDRAWIEGIRISLREMSKLKEGLADRFTSADVVRVLPGGAHYRLYSRTGIAPSFSDVKWMAMGVLRDASNTDDAAELDSGDVWVNALRVSGIKALAGWAMRGDLTTQWADFMNLSLNAKYEDADFRQMSENFASSRDSRVAGGLSAQWTLDKFLPPRLGFALPLSTSITGSIERPKIQPGSDIHLTHSDGSPDKLGDMYKDFAEMVLNTNFDDAKTKAEHWERTTVNRTLGASYTKGPTSENPLVNLTAERITTSASYGRDTTVTHKGARSDPALGDHVEISSKRTYRGKLGYDLSPRKPPEWTRWMPFKHIKSKDFPRQMKQYELTWLPTTLNFNLADGEYGKDYLFDTRTNFEQRKKRLGINQGFQLKMRPVKPMLDMDFDLAIVRKFDDDVQMWERSWKSFFTEKIAAWDTTWHNYYVTYGEKNRTQRASLRFSPQFFDWLTHSADYSASYNHFPQNRPADPAGYLRTGVNSAFNFRSGLRIRTLLGDLADAAAKRKTLSASLENMEKGLSRINLNDLNFTYNASLDLRNEYWDTTFFRYRGITPLDFFTYQLGKEGRSVGDIMTGDMNDTTALGGMFSRIGKPGQDPLRLYQNDMRSTSQAWTLSTNLRLPPPLDVSLNNLSLGWRRKYSHKPDTLYIDTTVTWPEIRAGASSRILDRITFLTQYMQSMDLSSGYSFTKDSAISYSDINISRTHAWAPLVSFRGTLKRRPITTVYSHDYTHSLSESRSRLVVITTTAAADKTGVAGNKRGTEKKIHGNTATVSYKLRPHKKSEIQILRWTIPIKGELDMGVTAKHSHTTEIPDSRDKPAEDRTEMSLSPHISYYFTENVKGELRYLTSRMTDEKLKEESINHQFTMLVRINF